MIIHGNKQISEIVYARKASEGGGAVRLTNIIHGAQVVFGGLYPYVKGWLDKATKAAILAAFGQDDGWQVIGATNAYLNDLAATDSNKATALAGFINEDPMLVCSLGLQPQGVEMPIRSLKGDGLAYINTGYNPSSETIVDTMIRYHGWIGDYDKQFGDTYGNIYIYSQMNSNGGVIRWVFGPNSTTYGYEAQAQDGRFHTIVLQRKSIVYDGTLHTFADCGTFQMTAPMYILANNTQSSRLQKSASYIAYFKMTTSGVPQREMYPFIRKIDGVDKLGMIDVLSDTFYQNAGSGSFTIAYTLPDGTPWTPLNQTP